MARLTVYDEINFGGASLDIDGDIPNLGDWNNRISSFKVNDGSFVSFYDKPNYETGVGESLFGTDHGIGGYMKEVRDLREFPHSLFGNWNDEIMSIKFR